MKPFVALAAILLVLATRSSGLAQGDDLRLIFAEPKKDWEWDEDKRFDFLVERLASLEASLDAVEKAIAKNGRKAGVRQGDARRAEANNTMMDRKGGGPMKWNEFYGTTAEKFFYHPTDRNTTYHTNTTLRQMGSRQDDKVGNGVPSSQSVPVHQRPPQFDYIYRANRDARDRAEKEAIALAGKVEELNHRRAQLEDEQAELWCLLAFRAIQRQNVQKKPMLRFALLPSGTNPTDFQKHEALTAATRFLATALVVIDKAEQDQATALTGIKQIVGPARSRFDDSLINLDSLEDDAANKKKQLGQFVALAQLLDDTSSNLSESYVAAMDGDRFKDEVRKDRFRGLLQRSLIEYAQILLALDELTNAMRKEWKIKVDTKSPAPVVSVSWGIPERRFADAFSPQPEQPTPAASPKPKGGGGADLKRRLLGTTWKNTNQFIFDWDGMGKVWHFHANNPKVRNPVEVVYIDESHCSVVFVNKARFVLEFDGAFKNFTQLKEDGGVQARATRLK